MPGIHGDNHTGQPKPLAGVNLDEDARAALADIVAQTQSLEVAGEISASELEEDVFLLFAPLTKEEVCNCMFSSWYPNLHRVSFKSEIIKPLEQGFIDYLLSDGIALPDDSEFAQYHAKIEDPESSDSEWSDSGDDDGGARVTIDIASTDSDVCRRIERLGGKVFPRMNWSAPKDASWMSVDNTLRCRKPSDIYILLKSSDRISGDLLSGRYICKELLGDIEPELVLRQWCNPVPAMEFRCFVKDKELIAISQIDYQHYEFLEEMRDEIETKLHTFFDEHICDNFPSDNYCFDAYIAQTVDRVYVVDFEPWTHSVDSCLFEWRELVGAANSGNEDLGLRLFPKGVSSLGHFSNKYTKNRFPVEATRAEFQGSMAALVESVAAQMQSK
ncbi:hypothetical protein GGI04_001157 [Coemansia thaxteri]|nr:hypothetical protein GGI04_001157 [Coemansia thaxteri]